MLCYNLDRFSEDIDLDGFDNKKHFFNIVNLFINEFNKKYKNLSFRKAKDTETVKRVFIHFGGIKQ